MAKIGVYGGTFNPPHRGHLLAIQEVQRTLHLDRVLCVPAAEPPHKRIPKGSPSAQERLELLQAAIQDLPYAEACGIELARSGKSYTAQTLRELKAKYPGDTLYLLTGTDMFLSLHTWFQPEEICALAVIVGTTREKGVRESALLAQAQRLRDDYGATVELVDNRYIEISSSMARRLLILGGAEHYVTEPVMAYIQKKKLYGYGEDYRSLPLEELRTVALSLLKPQRVAHVLGCAETAVRLAERYGADETDARRAGLLHDVTKAEDGPDQLLLVDTYGMIISDFERRYPKLLHAKTGAAAAEKIFGENEAVCDAIRWHTTGKPDMQLLEKIVYLADYMEPNRAFDGVESLRELAFQDLDTALVTGMDMAIAELIRENKPVCEISVEARDYLKAADSM